MTSAAEVRAAVAATHRSDWARIVGGLIRFTGDWTLAEDSAQEAFETALQRWERDGIPPAPGAWLTTVARNRAIDRMRRVATEQRVLRSAAALDPAEPDADDDRLRLLFTCCHPALGLEARVALTLRSVAGLTTAEIARAFLVPEPTMAQRLVRAKAKIAHAGIPYRVPPPELLGERLPGVLAVLYLLFTEGYSATSGDAVVREPLAEEAIRLARLLRELMPRETEVSALLALMLLHHARRAGRMGESGDAVPIDLQDRALWDAVAIDEAVTLLRRSGSRGPYALQASIAARHATSPSWEATDFEGIVSDYDALLLLEPSPVVALNRAIAIGMADGAAAGLDAVRQVADAPQHLALAAEADFLRRLGRREEAAAMYRSAIAVARTAPNRRYFEARLREVET